MIVTIEPTTQKQTVKPTMKPLVQYFDSHSQQIIAAGEAVHDYYGVPPWLMQQYLMRLDAAATSSTAFQVGGCRAAVSAAPRRQIGSLAVGGTRVEFTGPAGAIQAVLTELEWMTQRW